MPFLCCCGCCLKDEFLSHETEERNRWALKKHTGLRDGSGSHNVIFVLKACQAVSSGRKEGTSGKRMVGDAKVSNLFISGRKVTVAYQLTIRRGFRLFPATPAASSSQVLSFTQFFSPPALPGSFSKFTVTLHHLPAFLTPVKHAKKKTEENSRLPFPLRF